MDRYCPAGRLEAIIVYGGNILNLTEEEFNCSTTTTTTTPTSTSKKRFPHNTPHTHTHTHTLQCPTRDRPSQTYVLFRRSLDTPRSPARNTPFLFVVGHPSTISLTLLSVPPETPAVPVEEQYDVVA
jgi:hypothetical protein